MIDKCGFFDAFIVQREPDNNLLASLLLPYFFEICPSDEILCDILSLVVVAVITIVVIMIVAVMIVITIRMVVVGGNTMDNSFLYTKTLLLVDDELDLLKMLSDILKDAGFQKILMADTGKEAVAEAKKGKPDLIILDVMLPDKDGFSLMEQLRSFTDVPIIFLTAKDEAVDKLAGLGLGADDYIVKPFLPQELILRIYAVLRRSYKEDNPLVVLDGCTVDFDRAEVYKGNEIFFLTAKEHMLLKTLARNEGKIITVDALCEALWGDNPFGYENSLNAHVRRVREKIETDPSNPKSLITIKGLGYKLIMRK